MATSGGAFRADLTIVQNNGVYHLSADQATQSFEMDATRIILNILEPILNH